MTASTKQAFTLIELIVVMAIIITLSVIGFISYNSYVMDGRNAARVGLLEDAAKVIDQFIFQNGYAPKCAAGGAYANVCSFADDTTKVTAKINGSTGQGSGNGPGGTARAGIVSADWGQLQQKWKSAPVDPRGSYFLYAFNGSKYALIATKELTGGFSTIVRGSDPMEKDPVTPGTNVIKNVLGLTGTGVDGHTITNNAVSNSPSSYPANPSSILYNNYDSTANGGTSAIPYWW